MRISSGPVISGMMTSLMTRSNVSLVEQLDRLGAAGAGDRLVIEVLERADGRGAHARIVLDQQDARAGHGRLGFAAASPGAAAGSARPPRCAADRATRSCPCRASLSMPTSPPDWWAKPKIWLRPRPVPLPTGLVVKNGSKARSRTSSVMPQPVSVTEIRRYSPARMSPTSLAASVTFSVRDGQRARRRPSRRGH